MIKRIIKLIIATVSIGTLFSGCATTTLQTKVKLTKSILIDHSVKDNKNIYLQVTNTAGSGGENMQLFDTIKTKLTNKGYNIVNKSTPNGYGLFVNVLFANNIKEARALQVGGALGSTAALGAVATGQGGKGSLLIGVGAALGGAIISKALEDETFRAVVEISVRDYKSDVKDYTEFKTRSLSEAVKMNLKLDEAMPILEQEISRQITNLF